MKQQQARHLLEVMIAAARVAGDAIMAVYRRGEVEVSLKDDRSPVTEADLAAHRAITQALDGVLPGVPVLSEEGRIPALARRRDWSRFWLVDPLDGTREFIHRTGEFAVSIALIEDNYPLLGVLANPVSGRLYAGARLGGDPAQGLAFCREPGGEQRSLCTRKLPQGAGLDYPFQVVMSKRFSEPGASGPLALLRKALPRAQASHAGSALKFCRVAEGVADIYPALLPTSEWDSAAGQALVEAAGGLVVDLDGNRLSCNRNEDLLNPPFLVVGDRAFDWQRCLALLRQSSE